MGFTMDDLIREFSATGDIKGLSIALYCDLIRYARAFAPSVAIDLLEKEFFNFHF